MIKDILFLNVEISPELDDRENRWYLDVFTFCVVSVIYNIAAPSSHRNTLLHMTYMLSVVIRISFIRWQTTIEKSSVLGQLAQWWERVVLEPQGWRYDARLLMSVCQRIQKCFLALYSSTLFLNAKDGLKANVKFHVRIYQVECFSPTMEIRRRRRWWFRNTPSALWLCCSRGLYF